MSWLRRRFLSEAEALGQPAAGARHGDYAHGQAVRLNLCDFKDARPGFEHFHIIGHVVGSDTGMGERVYDIAVRVPSAAHNADRPIYTVLSYIPASRIGGVYSGTDAVEQAEGVAFDGISADDWAAALDAVDEWIRAEDAARSSSYGPNAHRQPTQAMRDAGNYKMGRTSIRDIGVAIENPRGSIRSGTGPGGKPWSSRMAAHYGYIVGSTGADGDGVDCFLGPWPEAQFVYVINQRKPGKGGFDEHKVMLGFFDEDNAVRAYKASYDRGWSGLGSVVRLTYKQLRWWLRNGNLSRPLELGQLPHDGENTMDAAIFDAASSPKQVSPLSFGEQIRQNEKIKAGTGKVKITADIHAWFSRKYGGGNGTTISSLASSLERQSIEINKAKGRMGVVTITARPFGDYLWVKSDDGAGKPVSLYFTVDRMTMDAATLDALNPGRKSTGEFREAVHGKWFNYRDAAPGSWGAKHGYPHEIFVGPNAESTRYANVKKTVAIVVTDEGDDGQPVTETWKIKAHNVYDSASTSTSMPDAAALKAMLIAEAEKRGRKLEDVKTSRDGSALVASGGDRQADYSWFLRADPREGSIVLRTGEKNDNRSWKIATLDEATSDKADIANCKRGYYGMYAKGSNKSPVYLGSDRASAAKGWAKMTEHMSDAELNGVWAQFCKGVDADGKPEWDGCDVTDKLMADAYDCVENPTAVRVAWDGVEPKGFDRAGLSRVLYQLRAEDAGSGLLMDAVTMEDIEDSSDGVVPEAETYDALIVEARRIERTATALMRVLSKHSTDLKPTASAVSKPMMRAGAVNQTILITMADGQTLTVWFHNPDTTPRKLLPTDELVSWKWMLNRKDVTIAVAPERGLDLDLNVVARRVMALAEKNSAAFVQANKGKADLAAQRDMLREQVTAKRAELESLVVSIESAKKAKAGVQSLEDDKQSAPAAESTAAAITDVPSMIAAAERTVQFAEMKSSAELCIADAKAMLAAGREYDAARRALDALGYTVGILSPLHQQAKALFESMTPPVAAPAADVTKTEPTPSQKAMDMASAMMEIGARMSTIQLRTVRELARGEEGKFFTDKIAELLQIMQIMPKTGETDGQGDDAVAHLHYFLRGSDFYITEQDAGAADDEEADRHTQCFGFTILNGDLENAEMGYINVREITRLGAEIDFHWTPTTIGAIKKAAGIEAEGESDAMVDAKAAEESAAPAPAEVAPEPTPEPTLEPAVVPASGNEAAPADTLPVIAHSVAGETEDEKFLKAVITGTADVTDGRALVMRLKGIAISAPQLADLAKEAAKAYTAGVLARAKSLLAA